MKLAVLFVTLALAAAASEPRPRGPAKRSDLAPLAGARGSVTLAPSAANPVLSRDREGAVPTFHSLRGSGAAHTLQLEFDELTATATAILDSVAGLERSAHADGHRLHPNLVAQRVLIESSMDSAERALRQRDWEALAQRLGRARAAIERLSRML